MRISDWSSDVCSSDLELAPDPDRLQAALKRVAVRRAGETADEEIVAALTDTPQGLVIVNSRAHALALYRKAVADGLDGVVHLTTRQYAAHRRDRKSTRLNSSP